MTNRRIDLRNSYGISDYPWSSDEDEMSGSSQMSRPPAESQRRTQGLSESRRRTAGASEIRHSIPGTPENRRGTPENRRGTPGVSNLRNSAPGRQEHRSMSGMPGTSGQSGSGQSAAPNTPQAQPARASHRRLEAQLDGDLFWTLTANFATSAPRTSGRSEQSVQAGPSDGPAAATASGSRPGAGSLAGARVPNTNIKRILAIRRFNRVPGHSGSDQSAGLPRSGLSGRPSRSSLFVPAGAALSREVNAALRRMRRPRLGIGLLTPRLHGLEVSRVGTSGGGRNRSGGGGGGGGGNARAHPAPPARPPRPQRPPRPYEPPEQGPINLDLEISDDDSDMRLNLDGDDSPPNLRGGGSPSLLQQIDNSVEQEVPDAEFSAEDLDLPHDSASNLIELDADLVEIDLAPLEIPGPPAERPATPAERPATPAEFPEPEIVPDPAPAVPDVADNPVVPDIPDGPVQQPPVLELAAAEPPDPRVPIPLPAPDPAPAPANAPQPPAENAAAAENAATTSAAPEQSPVISSNRGIKRKREDQEEEPNTVMEFNKNILRLLECPVCLEWMEPPMAQCRRGHLVCSRCRVRLFACPICRTAFSSVRNRAMEGVAEMLRYPCRHGCGRELRLRRRAPHESSCASRRHRCVAPHCRNAPMPHALLTMHYHSQHLAMVKIGRRHRFSLTLESQQHDNWVVMALRGLFHVRVDADLRSWGAAVHVAYLGPKCHAGSFIYEVMVSGAHKHRRVTYSRQTHCDLENITTNQNRQDCFHVTLDQVVNLLRNVSSSEGATVLHVEVEIKRAPAARGVRAAGPAGPLARPPSSSI